MITPTQNAINRYGEEAAQVFAEIQNAQDRLMEAFDLLIAHTDDVRAATDTVAAFGFIWSLLNDQRKLTLENLESPLKK